MGREIDSPRQGGSADQNLRSVRNGLRNVQGAGCRVQGAGCRVQGGDHSENTNHYGQCTVTHIYLEQSFRKEPLREGPVGS